MAELSVERFLAQTPLFGVLGARERASLAARSQVLACARGSVPVQAGAPVPGVLVLVSGAVRLSLREGADEERMLRIVSPHEPFCLASAVLDRPSPYQAAALAASQLLTIPAPAVRSLLERDAAFARGLVRALAARELELCAEIHTAAFRSGSQRLAAYLEGLAGEGARTVRLPCSKTLVAARLGMKKETLSRLLKRFAASGIIAVSRSEIAILDPVRLAAATREGARVGPVRASPPATAAFPDSARAA